MKLSRSQHHELYYFLRLNRRVDEQLTALYRQGKVVGGVYSGLGQEAISVGAAYALEPQDVISPVIRNMGAMLIRGFKPRDVFLQYMARQDGPTGGRDANTHFGDLSKGVFAPISMLGETLPVIAGAALAAKVRHEKRVALAFIGDGATSTGPFHEGMNFISVRKLPVIVIAENNAWAYSTPVEKQMAVRDIAQRAAAYAMPAVIVDGNGVLAVYEATHAAAERARRGDGPTLIEAKTMRMKGHAEHDDARYVPKAVFDKWRKKDPLLRYEKYLAQKRLLTAKEKAAIAERVDKEIRADVEFAESSPFPPPEAAARTVWA
jgi:TPP-dependent pyruvate/acetoin dehydrogenase alpha subunit